MPLPVDFAADWKRFNASLVRAVEYAGFDAATGDYTAAVPCVGAKGQEYRTNTDGNPTTRVDWTVTDLPGRAVLRSKIVDGADEWVILDAKPDPASGTVWQLTAYLA